MDNIEYSDAVKKKNRNPKTHKHSRLLFGFDNSPIVTFDMICTYPSDQV